MPCWPVHSPLGTTAFFDSGRAETRGFSSSLISTTKTYNSRVTFLPLSQLISRPQITLISVFRWQSKKILLCISAQVEPGANSEVHFGKGTRLTVLGKGEVPSLPNVTIFAPSTQELKEKKKATIVCLVTNFYPDHINLAWSVNGKERIQGVKTETPKKGSTGKYSLISRLRVTSHEWQDSNNKFHCKVDFYNWNEKVSYEEGIHGTVCDGGTAEAKETYLRTANFGKLVYILLIFKSILYGAFVMGLKLWKK